MGDVGIFRYEHFHSKLNGFDIFKNVFIFLSLIVLPKAIKFESGIYLNMNDKINEKLQEESHIWVVLKGIFYIYLIF